MMNSLLSGCQFCETLYTGFTRLLESPGFFFLTILGPGKSLKIAFVLEIKA